ncbi:hypothetical protein D3C73_1255750 [compost metagenome]
MIHFVLLPTFAVKQSENLSSEDKMLRETNIQIPDAPLRVHPNNLFCNHGSLSKAYGDGPFQQLITYLSVNNRGDPVL